MATLRQLLVQTLIGTMALGGVACLCPVAAATEVPHSVTHAGHEHGSMSPDSPSPDSNRQQADCGHEDCEAGCERGSAVAAKGFGGTGGKTVLQFDDLEALPPRSFVFVPSPVEVVSTDAYRPRVPLRQETPVQRCDRLLD